MVSAGPLAWVEWVSVWREGAFLTSAFFHTTQHTPPPGAHHTPHTTHRRSPHTTSPFSPCRVSTHTIPCRAMMQCHAMLYRVVPCHASVMPCSCHAMQCHAVPYCAMLCCVMHCYAMLCHTPHATHHTPLLPLTTHTAHHTPYTTTYHLTLLTLSGCPLHKPPPRAHHTPVVFDHNGSSAVSF